MSGPRAEPTDIPQKRKLSARSDCVPDPRSTTGSSIGGSRRRVNFAHTRLTIGLSKILNRCRAFEVPRKVHSKSTGRIFQISYVGAPLMVP